MKIPLVRLKKFCDLRKILLRHKNIFYSSPKFSWKTFLSHAVIDAVSFLPLSSGGPGSLPSHSAWGIYTGPKWQGDKFFSAKV
jgi:hypothetical protein